MIRPLFSQRESVRRMCACWAALLGRKCVHAEEKLDRKRTTPDGYVFCCECYTLVRKP